MVRNRLKIAHLFLALAVVVIPIVISGGCGSSEPPVVPSPDKTPVQPASASVPGSNNAAYVIAAVDSVNREGADFKCDGIDDQVEIQAAIDAFPKPDHFDVKQSGGRIILLDGNFYLTDSIEYRNYMALEGQGMRITCLHNQTDGKYAFEVQPYDEAIFNVTLSGFSIRGVPEHEGGGIHLKSVKNGSFRDIEIRRVTKTALWVDGGYGSWYNYFENIYCGRCGTGIRITGHVNEFTLIGGNIRANRQYNLEILQGSGHKFIGTIFEGGEIYLDKVNDCNFIACRFEGTYIFNGPHATDTILIGGRRTGWKLTDENGSLTDLQNAYLKVNTIADRRFGSAEIIGDGKSIDFTIAHGREVEPHHVLLTAANENMASAEHWISSKDKREFTITFASPPEEGQSYTFDWMVHYE